jgi:hypothetical protein
MTMTTTMTTKMTTMTTKTAMNAPSHLFNFLIEQLHLGEGKERRKRRVEEEKGRQGGRERLKKRKGKGGT